MRINRLAELESYLLENRRASIATLCEHFNVSLNTMRRDISTLVQRGLITKVYGGVILREEQGVVSFVDRRDVLRSEKDYIGQLAAPLVHNGDTIYIDSGTTAPMILPYLNDVSHVTIISNSLSVYVEAAKYPHLQFIAPGGVYYPQTNSFVGLSAVSTIRNYQIAIAFMAATAISLEGGAMNNSFHEAEVKKAVIAHAKSIAFMIDHTKLDLQAGICLCGLDLIDYYITDQPLPDAYQKRMDDVGVNVICS